LFAPQAANATDPSEAARRIFGAVEPSVKMPLRPDFHEPTRNLLVGAVEPSVKINRMPHY